MKASERHRLKEDKYAEAVAQVVLWARANQTAIVAVVAVALLVGVLAIWFTASRRSAQEAARSLLTEAESSARIALLEKPEKQADAVNEVVNRCELIVADYGDMDAAAPALLQAGQLLARTGRPEQAAAYFQRALNRAGHRDGLLALAQRGLAEALDEAGRPREAIAQYRVLLEGAAAAVGAQVSWDIGRCYEKLGERALAVESYRRAVEQDGDSAWAELARFRLANLVLSGAERGRNARNGQ